MDELEITQPEENVESTESAEQVEDQALGDATHEPGARIEETQTFEQAEAVEEALTETMHNVEQVEGTPVPIPTPEPAETEFQLTDEDSTIDRDEYGMADGSDISEGSGKDGESGEEATPINLPGPVAAVELSPDDVKGAGTPGEELGVSMEPVPKPEERGGVLPIPIPEPVEDGEELGTLPIPIPKPTMEEDVALSPDDVKLSEQPEPGPDPFPRTAEFPDPLPHTDLSPGVDGNVAGVKEPGGDPPGPNQGNRSEGGEDEGGEVTPINLPQMPEDDNEATPINLP